VDLTIRTAALPDPLMGLWDQRTRTVWLDSRLTPVERRCTLAHELVHAERGDVPCGDPALDARQETRVEREAARRLLPLARLAEVLRWSPDLREAAAELDVEVGVLELRLASLDDTERAALSTSAAAHAA
jgi:Zn-dependent peptidase ImmA (M78 family)